MLKLISSNRDDRITLKNDVALEEQANEALSGAKRMIEQVRT